MNKYLLFTPGPINVAANVRAAIHKEDICHREIDFNKLLLSVESKLLKLFKIKKHMIIEQLLLLDHRQDLALL